MSTQNQNMGEVHYSNILPQQQQQYVEPQYAQPQYVQPQVVVQSTPQGPGTDGYTLSPVSNGSGLDGNFKIRHYGLIGLLLLIIGICILYSNPTQGIIFIVLSIGLFYNEIEDKGNYLQLIQGPFRWALCGQGKEKINYSDILYWEETRAFQYGFGTCSIHTGSFFSGNRLFSQCGICCLCKPHRVIKIVVRERFQGEGAMDQSDCCLERCCLEKCCGFDNCNWFGSGCICKCCNPCNCNCCVFNNIYISTDNYNMDNLIQLLRNKCQNNKPVTYVDL